MLRLSREINFFMLFRLFYPGAFISGRDVDLDIAMRYASRI